MFTEMSEAVAMVRPADSLAVPLGPGVPGGAISASQPIASKSGMVSATVGRSGKL